MEEAEPSNEHAVKVNQSMSKCVKCSKEGAVYSSSKIAYCEECFLVMVRTKFRSTISKRKIFKDMDRKVMVLLDGSREAAFLFRQVEDAVKQKNFKRLMIEPCFVLLLYSMDMSDVHDLETRISVLRQSLPATYFIVHLAAAFGDLDVIDDNVCHGLEYLSKLAEFSNEFHAAVSREEAMRLLEIRLLQKLTRYTGISKLMVPSNSDGLAQLVISQLCLGRGSCISAMTDVVEKTSFGATFIRPLRDISSGEIEIALRLENVEHYVLLPEEKIKLSTCRYAFEASKKRSLQRMSSEFLTHFEEEGFKSTVPTILATSSKIRAPTGEMCCLVCGYSFSGKEKFCYTCSSIIRDLSPSFVDYICCTV